MTKAKIELGNIICLPLRDASGYSVVVITRKRGTTLLGYFVNIKLKEITDFVLVPLSSISPTNAINIRMFGTLGIKTGEWAIVGKLKDFNKKDWPIPLFGGEIPSMYYVDHFDENLECVFREHKKTKEEIDGLFPASLAGHGAIEIEMTEILKNVPPCCA
jgi:hypothetical protein